MSTGMFGLPRRVADRGSAPQETRPAFVVREALLDHWARANWTDGCQVDALPPLQPLTVITRNHFYHLIVLTPQTGQVSVRGGLLIPDWTEAILAGSSLGGSFLKLRGIYTSFCMELHVRGEVILTTPVQKLTLAHLPEA